MSFKFDLDYSIIKVKDQQHLTKVMNQENPPRPYFRTSDAIQEEFRTKRPSKCKAIMNKVCLGFQISPLSFAIRGQKIAT
jgi:hypothetical protein